MRALLLVLLAFPAAFPARASAEDPAPLTDEVRRLEGRRETLVLRLAEREAMLRDAKALSSGPDARVARENREAARLLEKAVEDTRRSLAALGAGLRKLREFGSALASLRLKPKAVFGASWVRGDVTLATAEGVRPLRAGDAFEGAGLISTGEGAANILLPDGTRMTLAPRTSFDTRTWTLYGGELYYETLLQRAAGELRRYAHRFEVRTPSCALAVRGTRFLLRESSGTVLTLFDGEVEVSRATATLAVPSGEAFAPGAVVETGKGETRALAAAGGLSVVLEPLSRLEAAKSGGPLVFLRRGRGRFLASGEEAQVLTPGGKAQAKGADWELAAAPSGAPALAVHSGSVVLSVESKRLDETAVDAWWDVPYRE
ncbi:MAG: FecR domain-containing protein [Elusimicrobiota bacterium]